MKNDHVVQELKNNSYKKYTKQPMKHLYIFILLTILGIQGYAQTQQGFVKIPTRRNADGSWRKGKYVQGATIEIQFVNKDKQSYVSGNDGHFSFSVSSPHFFVSSVTAKKGTFTFADADFSKNQWSYSKNPLEILVDDPDVLAKAREEGISKERTKLRKQIRAKEDEIENLKATNVVSQEQYNRMLDSLDQYRKSSEEIVRQIAEVFVTTDYDNLSDFNRELLIYIEDGDFNHIDSLLKTQGSCDQIYSEIKNEEAAIRKTEEDIENAKAYIATKKENFAQRLYYEYLALLEYPMKQDSALHLLKMRADLDTTKIEAILDYFYIANFQEKYQECLKYGMIISRYYNSVYTFDSKVVLRWNIIIADILWRLEDYAKSEELYLSIIKTCKGSSDTENLEILIDALDGLKWVYSATGNEIKCIEYYYQSVINSERLWEKLKKHETYAYEKKDPSNIRYYFRHLYDINKYSGSESFYLLLLEYIEKLSKKFSHNHEYLNDLAWAQTNLGIYYKESQRSECVKYLLKALKNYNKYNNIEYKKDGHYNFVAENELKKILTVLAKYYKEINDLNKAEKYYLQILDVLHSEVGIADTKGEIGDFYLETEEYTKSINYNMEYLSSYIEGWPIKRIKPLLEISLAYSNLHENDKSNDYFGKAIEQYNDVVNRFSFKYKRENIAPTFYNVGVGYWDLSEYRKGKECFSIAMSQYELLSKEDSLEYSSDIADSKLLLAACDNQIAYEHAIKSDFEKAHHIIDDAISLVPTYADFYDSKGEFFLMQGHNDKALAMWKKVLELDPNFLDNYPDGTNLSNGLKKLGLIE